MPHLGGDGGGWTGVDNTGTGLGLLPVREEELEGGDDAAVCHLPAVLHHVHPELEDVARADLAGRGLLRAFAQPLVVDEGSVAGLRVLEVKFAILVPEKRVVTGEDLRSDNSLFTIFNILRVI